MRVALKAKPRKSKENSASKLAVEEILAHGDSLTFTVARVSDTPGRIRITGATILDYKTAEPGDRLGAYVRLS